MTRISINSYLENYLQRGAEIAFAHRRGLRFERWSYKEVATTAFRFARELEARGVKKGERVALWAENGPAWVAAFYGCALRGAVVVPLDAESATDFVARVAAQTRPRLLLTDSKTKSGPGLDIPRLSLDALRDEVARHSDAPYEHAGASDTDLVEIIYTSGTTAEPRGVCITHRNLLANLEPLEKEIGKYLRWERLAHPIRFLCLLPLSHVFGQLMGIFVPQLLGGEVVFQESLNPAEIVSTIKNRRVNVVVTVPRLLDTLREHVERREAASGRRAQFSEALAAAKDWRPLKRWWKFRRIHRSFGLRLWAFVTGGASLSEESERFWRRLGFAVLQGYGMTETASLITVNHPFKNARGTVGKILPGQEVRLDESGEILVRGANVTPGYWNAEGADMLPAGAEGWLRTGDVGEVDAAGNIYFKGRKKDVIVTAAGMNIHPEDIEAALDRQPEIKSSAVVGVEGPRGPEPLAVLILKDAEAHAALAIERANNTLARHQQVRRWVVWPEHDFPRTTTQKVRKRDILERLRSVINEGAENRGARDVFEEPASQNASSSDMERSASRPHTQTATADQLQPASDSLSTLVASVVSDASGVAAHLGASAKLATDLRLDSLGRVELLSALEDRFQIEIDESAFTAATTLGDIERLVRHGGGVGAEADEASRYPYPRWAQRFPFTWLRIAFFYVVVSPITSILCWTRVRGVEHLRDLRGPVLFISNHITYVDPALILSGLPGRFRRSLAIAQEGERLRWWRRPPAGASFLTRVRWRLQYALVVSIFNTFSLPQKSGFRRSFAFAGESVERGFSLLVFPEGARTEDGQLKPFMGGIGLLASQLGVPVVPARIDGLFELKQEGRRFFAPPGSVSVTFGAPVTFFPGEEPARITTELERLVKEMRDA